MQQSYCTIYKYFIFCLLQLCNSSKKNKKSFEAFCCRFWDSFNLHYGNIPRQQNSKSGVHNSNQMAGQIFCCHIQGPKLIFLAFQMMSFSSKQAECMKFSAVRAKPKASAGHIWLAGRMLCTPALNVLL